MGSFDNEIEGVGFPNVDCNGLFSPLRADVHFPSCYNPEAGISNFENNMAWPEAVEGQLNCPTGWVHVPHLFLEVYWDTAPFRDRWPQGSQQPFTLSNGDVTGFSLHADFMSGWNEELLQKIINTCNTQHAGMHLCPGLDSTWEDPECRIETLLPEEVDGVLNKLPGNNPIRGWGYDELA
jgi:hypothetical protein